MELDSTVPPPPQGGRLFALRYCGFVALAVAGCAADLMSKAVAFRWLDESLGGPQIHWLIEGYVGFEKSLNRGALFGAGQGMSLVFAFVSVLAIFGIVYWLWRGAIEDTMLTLTLGLVSGGILGNLYDRLGLWNNFQDFAVRDWIRLSYNFDTFVWPNFNIADSLLVCGAAILMLHSIYAPPPSNSKPGATTA